MLLIGGGPSVWGEAYGGGGVLTRYEGGGDPVGLEAVASIARSVSIGPRGADGWAATDGEDGGPRMVVQTGGSTGWRMTKDDIARVGPGTLEARSREIVWKLDVRLWLLPRPRGVMRAGRKFSFYIYIKEPLKSMFYCTRLFLPQSSLASPPRPDGNELFPLEWLEPDCPQNH